MVAHREGSEARPPEEMQEFRLDLERWWELVREHLAHPSADIAVQTLDPGHELVLRSGWDWAGTKSIIDQAMAVATTQLLREQLAAESATKGQ